MEPGSKIRIGNDIRLFVKLVPGQTFSQDIIRKFDGFISGEEVFDLSYTKIDLMLFDKDSKKFVVGQKHISEDKYTYYYADNEDSYGPEEFENLQDYRTPSENLVYKYDNNFYKWNGDLVQIKSTSSSYPININSIKAYIINTTVEKQAIDDLKKKTKFIDRFPIEPMFDSYIASKYNIHSAGYPHYREFPHRHIIGPHTGFGYNPQWNMIYKPYFKKNLTEYMAPVRATYFNDQVEVFFPAHAQLFTGEYKLIIVAKLYEPGYSPNNLRTITTDYQNVFSLVSSSEEASDEKAIIYITPQDANWIPDDIYAHSGQFSPDTGRVTVSLTNNSKFDIDMSDEVLWYEGA